MFKDLIIYTPMYMSFFWAVVLLVSARKQNRAKYFLGIVMIAAFFVYVSHAVFFNQNHEIYIFFDPIYTLGSLSVYPLYYWYIKLLTVETKIEWYNLRLLAPAATMATVITVLYLCMTMDQKSEFLHEFLLKEETNTSELLIFKLQNWAHILSRLVFGIQVVFFLINGRKLVLRYNSRVTNFYSNLESKTIAWVNFLLYSFVITSISSIFFNIIGRVVFLNSAILLLVPSAIFSVLLFFIGLLGYMQNHTVADLVKDETQQPDLKLKDYKQNELKKKLMELFMKEKIYRSPDLKITQVSIQLKTNRTYISQLINNEFNCSFSEFVNEYRIIEAKELLANDALHHYSLNYISEKVGFGSLNTFIRVFKESEGITPGRFRDDTKLGK